MSDKPSFFAELKRRHVYKVAVAYAIVGWLLVQIATQVFPFLEIPIWVVRLVIALVAIAMALTSDPSGSIRCSLRGAAIHASKRSPKRLFRRANLQRP